MNTAIITQETPTQIQQRRNSEPLCLHQLADPAGKLPGVDSRVTWLGSRQKLQETHDIQMHTTAKPIQTTTKCTPCQKIFKGKTNPITKNKLFINRLDKQLSPNTCKD
jgi:hypothetical protein